MTAKTPPAYRGSVPNVKRAAAVTAAASAERARTINRLSADSVGTNLKRTVAAGLGGSKRR